MKYLKLFESFDRYDFGEYDGGHYIEMRKNLKHFGESEIKEISKLLNDCRIEFEMLNVNEPIDGEYEDFDIFSIDCGLYTIEIYSLGDYCYGIYSYGDDEESYGELTGDDTFHHHLYLVDSIDELVNTISLVMQRF